MATFTIKFWGVRGSYPVPGLETTGIGGNTSCTEIRINDALVIIDAGTGIIKLGMELVKQHFKTNKPIVATILFSHMHHDHNQGFPFFKPAYLGSSIFYLFGPKLFQEDIGDVLSRAMLPPFFPVELSDLQSARIIHNIRESEIIRFRNGSETPPVVLNKFREKSTFTDDDALVDVMKGYAHPKSGIIFYKIRYKGKTLVYASDTEGYIAGDGKLVNFARGCDVLIHDCQYTMDEYMGKVGVCKQGFGHSTFEMAAEVAKQAGVGKLVLFHHDPEHSDDLIRAVEKDCKAIFPNTVAAFEGLEIELL